MMEEQMNEVNNLYIIGCGGLGREVAWLVERINEKQKKWNLRGFIDDGVDAGTKIGNYLVYGDTNYLIENANEAYCVCAIASPKIRQRIITTLKENGLNNFATLVDPSVIKSDSTSIGEGTIICAGSIISVNTKIENHVIVDWESTVGHDSIISDFCTVYPGANISGQVTLDKYVQVGAGAVILQGLSIGSYSFIGAGATVVKNIGVDVIVVGTPAHPISKFKN